MFEMFEIAESNVDDCITWGTGLSCVFWNIRLAANISWLPDCS